jgi:hypothetical protein
MGKRKSLAALSALLKVEISTDKNDNVILTSDQAEAINDHLAENEVVVKELVSKNAELTEQAEASSAAVKSGSALPTFTHNKKSYQFKVGKFSAKVGGKHTVYTAEEAAKDKELIAVILEKYSGLVEEIK